MRLDQKLRRFRILRSIGGDKARKIWTSNPMDRVIGPEGTGSGLFDSISNSSNASLTGEVDASTVILSGGGHVSTSLETDSGCIWIPSSCTFGVASMPRLCAKGRASTKISCISSGTGFVEMFLLRVFTFVCMPLSVVEGPA